MAGSQWLVWTPRGTRTPPLSADSRRNACARSAEPLHFIAVVAVAAECPNACNGHGTCSSKDQCQCDPGYKGNDCALRSCQYELAWVDTPRGDLNHDGALTLADGLGASNAGGLSKVQWSASLEYEVFPSSVTANHGVNSDPLSAANNEAHFYAECSNRGSCNTDSGECECQPGYTGSACQRGALIGCLSIREVVECGDEGVVLRAESRGSTCGPGLPLMLYNMNL